MQALAQEFLKTPVEIKFGEGNVLNANKNITQVIKVRPLNRPFSRQNRVVVHRLCRLSRSSKSQPSCRRRWKPSTLVATRPSYRRWVKCAGWGCCGVDASRDCLLQTIVFVSRKDLCDSVAAGLWDKG